MDLNFNFFNNLIISGAIQGVIFASVILFNKKYKSSSNFYLALVILFLSLNNLYYWVIDIQLDRQILFYDNLYIPWNLLILPCYFFFVLSYLQFDKEYKKLKRYLLFPFFISLFIHFFLLVYHLFLSSFFIIPLSFIHWFYYGEEYISLLFTVFVIYKTFVLIKKYEKETSLFSLKTVIKKTKWLKQLLFFGLFICFVWAVITLTSQNLKIGQIDLSSKYLLWLNISFLVYWLGYLGIYHNGIFSQREEIRKSTSKIISQEKRDYKGLKIETIKSVIENEKLFLNPSFNLKLLSEKLNMNESHISHVFNQNSKENLSFYINTLRVNYAKKLLSNLEYNKYTIISIALEAGFNSKSSFYNIFKKMVGISPSQYRKENMS